MQFHRAGLERERETAGENDDLTVLTGVCPFVMLPFSSYPRLVTKHSHRTYTQHGLIIRLVELEHFICGTSMDIQLIISMMPDTDSKI